MVKNIPTIERSTKIRFGKYATDDQGENTIVFNASNAAIDTSVPGSIYMTPLRSEDIRNPDVKILTYNRTTKEVLDSNVTSDDIFSMNLEFVTNNDNVTSNTVRFINDTTAFVTTGNVGIHNTSPTHALDVGSQFHVTEGGEVRIGPSVLIDSSVTNQIQVSGRIDTDSITLDHIGIANNNPTITGLSLGSTTFLQNPTASINAFSTVPMGPFILKSILLRSTECFLAWLIVKSPLRLGSVRLRMNTNEILPPTLPSGKQGVQRMEKITGILPGVKVGRVGILSAVRFASSTWAKALIYTLEVWTWSFLTMKMRSPKWKRLLIKHLPVIGFILPTLWSRVPR